MPIRFDDVKDEVCLPNSETPQIWRDGDIKPFIRSLRAYTKDYKSPEAGNVIYPEVRLAGRNVGIAQKRRYAPWAQYYILFAISLGRFAMGIK